MLSRRAPRHREELRVRASRQEVLAELGLRALGGLGLERLLEAAAAAARRELGADYASVFELTGDRRGLLVREGAGFPEGLLGGVLASDPAELPGLALDSSEAVVVEDLGADSRVRPSSLERDLGATSAMAAPVGVPGRRFGVIAVHSRRPREFTEDDVHFLCSIANLIALATQRARHEQRMRDSEARFRELADSTPALMWVTDSEGNMTFVNEAWQRFTGRRRGDELGDTFGESAHPDDRPELLMRWRDAFRRREEFRFEYRLRHARSGGHRWVLEVGTPRIVEGQFLGYVGTSTDIHQRRAMEEALRESEAGFRDLADTAPVMIWTTDTRGLVTFVNEGWMRFTGTTLEEELGASWTLGVHPDDVDEMQVSWDEALSERGRWEFEYRLQSRTGEYRWIVDRGVPRFEGGAFAGYVGTAIDIHERKLMEARLRRVYEQEHTIAETLQRSLLPERLPALDGLALAARYLPAGSGSAVGGDWFDALERPDGRVALVVGDVVGHGLRAAATMGQLRNAFRAYALVESSPAEVMNRVNDFLTSGDGDAMATALYLVLDRAGGEVVFSAAGHPQPLLLAPDGARYLEGGRSVPVGASASADFRQTSAVLPPGATLLLYTDGLVERRDRSLDDRLEELARAAAEEAASDLDRLCEHVLHVVLGDLDPADDVALLAVRVVPNEALALEG